jgi:anti-sigma regulatory factor (Ser/Thr protein kinase)
MPQTVPAYSIVIAKDDKLKLSDFRREVIDTLKGKMLVSDGDRNGLVLVVNEIVANILRHSNPTASEIRVDFEHYDGKPFCVIRDNGGSFARFSSVWQGLGAKPFFGGTCIGLGLVKAFFPDANYAPKNAKKKYNEFRLPLDGVSRDDLPSFFQTEREIPWNSKTIM